MKSHLLLPGFLIVFSIAACDDASKSTDSKATSAARPSIGTDHKAAINQGWAAYRAKDYEMAYHKWLPAAEAGDTQSQYMIGRLYDRGRGIVENDVVANEWYRKAAEKGYAKAQYRLGIQLYYGYGTPGDFDQAAQWKRAAKWFRAAAQQGYAKAHGWLGYMHEQGIGLPVSMTEAVKWYRKGAALGDNKSLYSLAQIQSDRSDRNRVADVPVDDDAAVKNYLKAARNGDYWSAQNLERLFYEGRTSLKPEELVQLFADLARRTTDGTGQLHLARIYLEGRLTERDVAKAIPWLERAATRGCTRSGASFRLAMIYLAGDGVPRDTAKAAEYLKVVAERDSSKARLRLAFLYANGDGVPQDYAQAYYWASLAADAARDREASMHALQIRAAFEHGMSDDDILRGRQLIYERQARFAEKKRQIAEKRAKEVEEGFAR